jgi:deoxyribose-phosphate aldolase
MGAGWATPATFRFGASGLLDALLAVVEGTGDESGEPAGEPDRGAPGASTY